MSIIRLLIIASFYLLVNSTCNSEETSEIERPAITNTEWKYHKDDTYKNPYEVNLFSPKSNEDKDRLWSQTKSIFGYGLGVVGFIALLPEDVSNWDKDGKVLKKWGDNVTGGPVWDRDVGWINYIGHPYFGGVYYQAARKSGYRQWDSFIYSFMMSTFYWEYGVEAFAEKPAIQDLIVTPVLGWAVGEWAYQQEQSIRQNGSQVMDSDFWGTTALFFLDPVDSLGRGINNLFGRQIVEAGTGNIRQRTMSMRDGESEELIEVSVRFPFGSGKRLTSSQYSNDYYNRTNDPIDTSIIGLGVGIGYTNLDPIWQLEDDLIVETSLGLYFTRQFSARLSYARGNLKNKKVGSEQIDDEIFTYENYSINGQYYFRIASDYRPYITLGIGEEMRDQDRDKKSVTTHFGIGLHIKLTNKMAIQTDVRRFNSREYDTQDDLININFIYRLNKGEWF